MKKIHRPSAYTREALALLAALVEAARRERGMPQAELAERVGVSINTLKGVLRGQPHVAIGTAFEVASVLGVPLFGFEPGDKRLASERRELESRLALLPRHVHKPRAGIDDEF